MTSHFGSRSSVTKSIHWLKVAYVDVIGIATLLALFVVFPVLLTLQHLYPTRFYWVYRLQLRIWNWVLFLSVVVLCLLPPLLIWALDEFRRGKTIRANLPFVLSAMIAGLPVSTLCLWIKVGVPPTDDPAVLGLPVFFLVELAALTFTIWAGVKLRTILHGTGRTSRFFGFTGLILANIVFFALPVAWTVVWAQLASASLELTTRNPDLNPDSNETALVAHLSDLHISDKGTTRDGKEPGNCRLPALIQQINRHRPRYLVISGDLTDMGEPKQWVMLKSILADLSADTRIILTPGNHDLNQFFAPEPTPEDLEDSDAEDITDLNKAPRLTRMLIAQSEYLPAMLSGNRAATISDLLRDMPTKSTLGRHQKDIRACGDACRTQVFASETPQQEIAQEARCTLRCEKDWKFLRLWYLNMLQQDFPLVYVDQQSQVAFFSLASVFGNSNTPGQNAIGFIDDGQIQRFRESLHSLPPTVRLIVVTLHHPLFEPKPPHFPTVDLRDLLHLHDLWKRIYVSDWFLSVFLRNNSVQARKFYLVLSHELRQRNASAIMMFGHRHLRSLSVLGNVIFEEAPNVASEQGDSGFYTVTAKADSEVHVSWWPVHTPPAFRSCRAEEGR